MGVASAAAPVTDAAAYSLVRSPSFAPEETGLDLTERVQGGVGDPLRAEELVLPQDIADQIVAHLVRSLPAEGCGLLAVRSGESSVTAVMFYEGRNVDRSATRYTMEPRDVLGALRDIDRHGWLLGAIVHSHPGGPPTPSPVDLSEARYPGVLLGIVGMASRPPRLRFWRLHRDRDRAPEEVGWRLAPPRADL